MGPGSEDWEEEGTKGLQATALPRWYRGISVPLCSASQLTADLSRGIYQLILLTGNFSAYKSHFGYESATGLFFFLCNIKFLRLECWHCQLHRIIINYYWCSLTPWYIPVTHSQAQEKKGKLKHPQRGICMVKGCTSQTVLRDPRAVDLFVEVTWLGLLGPHLLNKGIGNTNPYF